MTRPCTHKSRLAALLGREFIGTELDLNLFKRASKFEWHLRVVLVDDWRSGILTAARLRISANLPMARSTLLSLIGALGSITAASFSRS